jgi:hypothetical protein
VWRLAQLINIIIIFLGFLVIVFLERLNGRKRQRDLWTPATLF